MRVLHAACGLLLLLSAAVAVAAEEAATTQRYRHSERSHPRVDVPEHHRDHGHEAPGRYRAPERDEHSYGDAAPAVRVPCKPDDFFFGTTFENSQRYPATTTWIRQ